MDTSQSQEVYFAMRQCRIFTPTPARYVPFHKLVPRAEDTVALSALGAQVAASVRPDSFIQAWVRLWRKPGEDRSMVT